VNQRGTESGSTSSGLQTGKAVAVIVVVVVIGWLALAKGTKAPSTAATPTTHPTHSAVTQPRQTVPTTTVPLLPASTIKLQVLNGVGTGSYAGEWSNKIKTKYGYNTLTPDNATTKVTQSAIYVITPGYLPEAQALATAVGLPKTAIVSANPLPANAPIPASERTSANLVLVIGPNLVATA
jgi:hypothetical protein